MRRAVAVSLAGVSLGANLMACAGEDPCVAYCDAVLAADCGDRDESCAKDCRFRIDQQIDQGFDCEDAFDALLTCEADQTFTCVLDHTTLVGSACDGEELELDDCLGLEGGG